MSYVLHQRFMNGGWVQAEQQPYTKPPTSDAQSTLEQGKDEPASSNPVHWTRRATLLRNQPQDQYKSSPYGNSSSSLTPVSESDFDESLDSTEPRDPLEHSILSTRYSNVVRINGAWVAISCFVGYCGANAGSRRYIFFSGLPGLLTHIRQQHHREIVVRGTDELAKKCAKIPLTEEDVALIRQNRQPITPVEPVYHDSDPRSMCNPSAAETPRSTGQPKPTEK